MEKDDWGRNLRLKKGRLVNIFVYPVPKAGSGGAVLILFAPSSNCSSQCCLMGWQSITALGVVFLPWFINCLTQVQRTKSIDSCFYFVCLFLFLKLRSCYSQVFFLQSRAWTMLPSAHPWWLGLKFSSSKQPSLMAGQTSYQGERGEKKTERNGAKSSREGLAVELAGGRLGFTLGNL